MKVIWQVELDRYSDESMAKDPDGLSYSLMETAEIFIEEYNRQRIKPEIQVISIGLGAGFCDILKDRKIPHKEIKGILHRVGSADIIKIKGE